MSDWPGGMASAVTDWRSVLWLVIIYCVAPFVAIHLAALIWPRGHPRRLEIVNDYARCSFLRRPFHAADTLLYSIRDGTRARLVASSALGRLRLGLRRAWWKLVGLGSMMLALVAVDQVDRRVNSTAAIVAYFAATGVVGIWNYSWLIRDKRRMARVDASAP